MSGSVIVTRNRFAHIVIIGSRTIAAVIVIMPAVGVMYNIASVNVN